MGIEIRKNKLGQYTLSKNGELLTDKVFATIDEAVQYWKSIPEK